MANTQKLGSLKINTILVMSFLSCNIERHMIHQITALSEFYKGCFPISQFDHSQSGQGVVIGVKNSLLGTPKLQKEGKTPLICTSTQKHYLQVFNTYQPSSLKVILKSCTNPRFIVLNCPCSLSNLRRKKKWHVSVVGLLLQGKAAENGHHLLVGHVAPLVFRTV